MDLINHKLQSTFHIYCQSTSKTIPTKEDTPVATNAIQASLIRKNPALTENNNIKIIHKFRQQTIKQVKPIEVPKTPSIQLYNFQANNIVNTDGRVVFYAAKKFIEEFLAGRRVFVSLSDFEAILMLFSLFDV